MSSSAVASLTINSQNPSIRQSSRQTRTNPSRASRTIARSSFAFGHSSNAAETPPAASVPHGFYPALTHFTDAIAALPREFRRHNSLLKEVDAKAWALEDNLLRLLKAASDSEPVVPCPPNPAPIIAGVVREDALPKDLQTPEPPESRNRRLLFDRVRHTLSDLMMTADEKNHVITNANEELDRQMLRLDSVFPYIAGEISEETRLGSLTHWAYSNKNTAKVAERERPRRETASHRHHDHHETDAASRSEARREAALARKQRRNHHADSDFDEHRVATSRKGQASKARGGGTADHTGVAAGSSAQAKRRKIERPPPVDTAAAAMERSNSGAGRINPKDPSAPDTGKKRSRAPNGTAPSRKRNNTVPSVAESPVMASPVVGALNSPRHAASPGPNGPSRPSSSRNYNSSNQASSGRQRPSSSASNLAGHASKAMDSKSTPKDATPVPITGMQQGEVGDSVPNVAASIASKTSSALQNTKREDAEMKPSESIEGNISPAPALPAASIAAAHPATSSGAPAASASKGRSSKTSTPVLSAVESYPPQRVRQTRSTDPAPAKRSKKNNTVAVTQPSEDEESFHEGDDEDEDSEPRYCYCNEISFGDMVACDNDACPREWFHLSCVGLTKPPVAGHGHCNLEVAVLLSQ